MSRWATSTAELIEEARLIGDPYPVEEPGFYVAFELGVTTESTERAAAALEADDRITALMHIRLVIEIAIRLAWVKAPIQARDRMAIARRLRRILERDQHVLLSADDAVRKHAGFPMLTNREAVFAELAKMPKVWDVELAPQKLEILAKEAEQTPLYGVYRYASTLAHPGLGQKLTARAPEQTFWQYLRFGHAAAALHGVALLDGLRLLKGGPAKLPLNEAAYHAFGRLEDHDGDQSLSQSREDGSDG